MDKELIKYKLSQDLKKITKEDFNEKILQEINTTSQAKKVLFDEKSIFTIFILISFFALSINYGLITKLKTTDSLIISIVFSIPIFLLIFNKIYKLSISKL